jgi:hypothetical protein
MKYSNRKASPRETSPRETPPLTRGGRRAAEAAMEAAKFQPTLDGKRMVRQYEAHGIVVTEWVSVEQLSNSKKQ